MRLLKAPLLLVMTLICITSVSTFASKTFTPVLDTTNLSGYVEITPKMGNIIGRKQYFDTIGIDKPVEYAIFLREYYNRLYAPSSWFLNMNSSVFILDSTYVDESKIKPMYSSFKTTLQELRNKFGNFTIKRASDFCNDTLLCQAFYINFANYVNVELVNSFMNTSKDYYVSYRNYPYHIGSNVGDHEIHTDLVMLFPNPVKDKLTLQFTSEQTTNQSYEILDLTGKVMQSGELKVEAIQTMLVNVGYLSKGTYLLKIDNSITKFIKD